MQTLRDAYLENQVLTATPQRLRLMLIDGALRFLRQTLLHWEANEPEAGSASLERARGIVSELMSSIRPDGSELTRKVAGIYMFLYRELVEASLERSGQRVRGAIDVLEVERETWQQLCEQVPLRVSGGTMGDDVYQSSSARSASAFSPATGSLSLGDSVTFDGGGLVLDA